MLALCIPVILICTFSLYQFKPQSAFGRVLIWKITWEKVKEYPLIGVGYNQYKVEYNNWQADYFLKEDRPIEEINIADNVTLAYNEYLQILAETGGIGFILFIFFLVTLIKKIIICLKHYQIIDTKSKIQYQIILSAFVCLLSILLMAFFSYPLQVIPIQILFILCLGILSGCLFQVKDTGEKNVLRGCWK